MTHLPFKRKTHEATDAAHYDEHDRHKVLAELSYIRQEIEALPMERSGWTDKVVTGEIDAERYGREMDAIDMREKSLKKHEQTLLVLMDKIQPDLARTAFNSQ